MMTHQLKQTRFYVTATGINVGKTIVTLALLQAFNKHGYPANGYKPLTISLNELDETNKDTLLLQAHGADHFPSDDINPLQLTTEQIWQPQAMPLNSAIFSEKLAHIHQPGKVTIIEGTGGWRMLYHGGVRLSDWVADEKLAVIMVVGIQSGCINHAILTAEAIQHDGLQIAGWVANRINPGESFYTETIATLAKQLTAPMIGEIPYIAKPESKDLSGYINLEPLYNQ